MAHRDKESAFEDTHFWLDWESSQFWSAFEEVHLRTPTFVWIGRVPTSGIDRD